MSLLVNFISGLSIGILGSVHCIGMCGPLALSLPVHQNENKILSILKYNLGRTTTYTFLGALFGLIGKSFSIFHMQQILSIIAGVILLFILFGYKKYNFRLEWLNKFNDKISGAIQKMIREINTTKKFFGFGILNGLLPCGLVYVALISGMALGDIFSSAILMFGFGLGTIPLLFITMYLGNLISLKIRAKINKLTPAIITGVAVLLIIRGLGIGIPYISPKITEEKVSCCHK